MVIPGSSRFVSAAAPRAMESPTTVVLEPFDEAAIGPEYGVPVRSVAAGCLETAGITTAWPARIELEAEAPLARSRSPSSTPRRGAMYSQVSPDWAR